jgi:hypothetical protein
VLRRIRLDDAPRTQTNPENLSTGALLNADLATFK